jgi:hypothetical protein
MRAQLPCGGFLDSRSLTRRQERAACRALLGSSAGGCGHFPARNCWTATGRFFAACGQNARTQSFPGRTRSRVSRICSRPAPKRRLENDRSPPSISSPIPLNCFGSRTRARLAPIAISRLAGRYFAIYLPPLRLELPTQAFVPSPKAAKACPGQELNSRKRNHARGPCVVHQRVQAERWPIIGLS